MIENQTLLPLRERGALKRLVGGFFALLLGVFALQYGNSYIGYVAERLDEQDAGLLLFGTAFNVLVHGSQVLLLLLAWVLIGKGVGSYFNRGQIAVNLFISSAGIWTSWTVLPLLFTRLAYTFPLDIWVIVVLVGIFQLLTLQVENWVDTSAAMLLWVYSFQSLELLPAFPTDVQALSVFFHNMRRPGENSTVISIAGTSLFLSFMAGALTSTWLLARYSIRLGQVRRFWENELHEITNDGIREVSIVDMRSLVHDLRNPLAAIKGMAIMLRGGAGENGAEKADVMLKAANYMERMIGEILHEDQRRAVKVGSFFDELEKHIRPFPWGEYVSIVISPDAKELFPALNEIRFTRALLNILDNAWRANLTAGTTNIALHVRRDAKFLEIEVLDNGPGYVPQSSGGQKSGWGSTGLGLAFARKVVSAHGGKLLLARRSDGASGASVLISVPIFQAPPYEV